MLNILVALLILGGYSDDTQNIQRMDQTGEILFGVHNYYNMRGNNDSDCFGNKEWIDLGEFEITAYTAGFESCGKLSSDPGYGITKSGLKVTENQTIATDWGIIPQESFVIIEGMDPIYVVEDTGSAIKGNRIDIYMENLGEAQQWGRQNRRVWVMEE